MHTNELVAYLEGDCGGSVSELTHYFQVSARTIRSHVHSANQMMSGFARVTFSNERNAYVLTVEDQDRYEEWKRRNRQLLAGGLASGDRIPRLLNYLLLADRWTTISDLASMLFVSQQSISSDLKEVESILTDFNLVLAKRPHYGIRIEGSEMDRRICMASVTSSTILEASSRKGGDLAREASRIGAIVERVLSSRDFSISSVAYQNLVVHLVVAIERIKKGCYVPLDENEIRRLSTFFEHDTAVAIAHELEREEGIELPKSEVAYITIHLAGKRTLETLDQDSGTMITESVWDVVSLMLEKVRRDMRVDLRSDLELRMNLARHVLPLSARLRYGIQSKNPLLSDIKVRYPLAWSMALCSAEVLEDRYGVPLSEDECAYIALPFALALERMRVPAPKKNVLIVCASGLGSAQLLRQRFLKEFGALLERCDTCDVASLRTRNLSDVDYVFTTVPVPKLSVPVCQIDFFFDRKASDDIRHVLEGQSHGGDVFRRQLFFAHLDARSKDECISFLCNQMVGQGLASDGLERSVRRRELMEATSFGNHVALPHPLEPQSETTTVAVAVLDEAIVWDALGHEVQAVFLVSYGRDAGQESDGVISDLADFFMDEKAISRLIAEQTWDSLVEPLNRKR